MDSHDYYVNLGQNIRIFRKMSGMTQKQLADAVHRSLACISKYEKGDIAIDIFTLQSIADRFRVPIAELLPKSGQPGGEEAWEPEIPPFFHRSPLYLYWYRDKKNPLTKHVLEIESSSKKVSFFMEVGQLSAYRDTCRYTMSGQMFYKNPNIFIYAENPLISGDFILLGFSPVDLFDSYTVGFLCCLNRSYHVTASKCFIADTPNLPASEILQAILVSREELTELKRSNFFTFGAYHQDCFVKNSHY